MSRLPPIPKDNRSEKGSGVDKNQHPEENKQSADATRSKNPETTGQQANTKINTTHQGHQQDR